MTDISQQSTKTWKFGDEEIEVIFRKATPPEGIEKLVPVLWFPRLQPGESVDNGIRCERDVPVKMRDGTTVYIDIYRPEGGTNLPAIVAWSPYGKRGGYAPGGTIIPVGKHGIPPNVTSPMAKFEAPDPAYWCHYGYAVINVDPRGVGYSEGDVVFMGTQEGQDAYDLIEWVASRDWCNKRVTMQGNSWLGMIQWFAAAERPPHLTCIAPWEGCSDMYRDFCVRGGILESGISDFVANLICGPRGQEDIVAMARKYPLMNGYWEDKIAKVENIEIPTYVLAGYTNV
jgi:predicted acyl esterase